MKYVQVSLPINSKILSREKHKITAKTKAPLRDAEQPQTDSRKKDNDINHSLFEQQIEVKITFKVLIFKHKR